MRLSYTTYRLNCKHPFGISRSTYNYYDRVFIYLKQDGLIGRGEAAPSERYKESIPQILDRLKNKIMLPDNVNNIDEVIKIIDQYTINIKSLRSACINALYDWLAKNNNVPLYEYLNYSREIQCPTSYTIAIGDLNDIAQKIEETEEFKILKVKLGTSQDKKIISTIRQYTDKPIRVDANEGWDSETAIAMIDWLSDQNVELIEQPLPADDIEKMSDLKKHSFLPIIADENCHTSADIDRIANGFDGVNIKLAKCGGIDEAIKMIEVAKKHNLKIMLGCMVESSIGITALGQLAAQANYLDLDGNLLIDNDPYHGLHIENGIPVLPTGIGIDLNLNQEYKNNFTKLK